MATTKKTAGRKYGSAASQSVEREMKAMKEGKLKSGGSGQKVTDPNQAIAIGLSEARKSGAKVPPAKKAAAKKSSAKKTAKKAAQKRAQTEAAAE